MSAEVTNLDVPSGAPARVPTPQPGDPRLTRLSLNQRTCANWSLAEAVDGAVRAGLPSIGVWREPLAEIGVEKGAALIRAAGLRVSSLCRGGFFTDPATFSASLDENRRAIDEAVVIGAPALVLVPGGLPAGSRDLSGARSLVAAALAELAPYAHDRGIMLAIEPMHPIYAADRGVVSTLAQALDLAAPFDPADVGVVVDAFHLWWEPDLLETIAAAGPRIASYQVGDWITPLPPDALLSRGMMGDGHIDFETLTRAVVASGYTGDIEVEIFNADVWAASGDEVVATLARRYVELVEPFVGSVTSS